MSKKSVILTFMLLTALVVTASITYRYIPSYKILSLKETITALSKGEVGLIIEDKIIEGYDAPLVYEEEILMPVEVIQNYIDKDLFIEEDNIIITKEDKYIRLKIDERKYYENYEMKAVRISPKIIDGKTYMPIEAFEKLYNIDINYLVDSNLLIIDDLSNDHIEGTIIDESVARQDYNIKSPITAKLNINDKVRIYTSDDEWTFIRTNSGELGYVKTKYIINPILIAGERIKEISNRSKFDKINLLWYQISSKSHNPKVKDMKKVPSINVISPTWYHISGVLGEINDISDKSIVEWAHKNDQEVWALLANNFGDKNATYEVLKNVDTREKLIQNIIKSIEKNNIDGINIDIESISKETGIYYVQFIKELSTQTKRKGIILSLDMYVPSKYTEFYNREVIGKAVDYFCVMAYDEHWSTCSESGSVSSLPWADNGIYNTIELVDNKKVILGMPSYTRLWKENMQGNHIEKSATALGMDAAKKLLTENNAKMKFDIASGQNYGEFVKDDIIYRIWLEDEKSVEGRLDIAKKYNLAGVATWKKGFEKNTIWKLYNEYLND